MSDLTLTVTREITASIQSVYNAWLDPAMLCKFMIPGEGMTVPVANADPRVGGRFELIMAAGEQKIPHGGEYKALIPYSQIVFTWESPFSVEGSTVTLNFSEKAGITLVELTHVKFADEETCSNHQAGWQTILTQLATLVTE